MGYSTHKNTGMLTYPGTNIMPLYESYMASVSCGKRIFWVIADQMPLGADISFKIVDEEDHHVYQTRFEDHPEGEGIVVDP